jgi:hypothetical protein
MNRLHALRRLPVVRNDDGASLLLALILVTVVSVGVSVILTMTDTSFRVTERLRDQAAATYTADGAIQAAINDIRANAAFDGSTPNCFQNNTPTLNLTSFYGTGGADVTCLVGEKKVTIHCPSLSNCNRPGAAILTLGQVTGEDGLNIQQPTGSTFRVHGTVFSNSNINVVNGSLNTNSAVYARGACSGVITSNPAVQCNYTKANTVGDDPNYQPVDNTVPQYQQLPACTTPKSVVTFKPGYYDDAVGLSDMMAGNSACRHSTWWFQPGTYYFDFHNSGSASNPLLPAGGNEWTLNDGYLVAGTPTDAAGTVVAVPSVPAVIPGACDNPINDANAVGVQFIFGSDSHLSIKAGQAEICGTYSINAPPVAIYGLTKGSAGATGLTGGDTLKLTAVPSAGDFGASATVANLVNADGTQFARWSAKKKNDSGSLTVGGFQPPAQIPAGSVLTAATVKVVHRHTNAGSKDPLTVSLSPTGGSGSVTGSSPGQAGGTAWRTESMAVDTGGTGALANAVHAGTFTGATIAVTASLSASGDVEDIDSIELELTYVAPAFRAGTGCITATPYTGVSTGRCALVRSEGTSGNQFYVQGTTYAPGAVIDITLNNAAEQVFRFGVISRSLWVKETGSFSYGGVVIEVPDDSPGLLGDVYLCAYLPDDQWTGQSCQGAPSLIAKVGFMDDQSGRTMYVLSWHRSG